MYKIQFVDEDGYDVCTDYQDTKKAALKAAKLWQQQGHRKELGMSADQFSECTIKIWDESDRLIDELGTL